MPTTITANAQPEAAPQNNGRRIDRDSTGRLWALIYSAASFPVRHELWYSTDDGATWAENTNARLLTGSATDQPNASIFIDSGDHLHVVYWNNNTTEMVYANIWTLTTTASWGNVSTVSLGYSRCDIVAFAEPGGTGNWRVALAYGNWTSQFGGGGSIVLNLYTHNSSGARTASQFALGLRQFSIPSPANDGSVRCSLDFRHTGDGKTVASGAPDIWLAMRENMQASGGLYCQKFTWATGNTWTAGTTRTLVSGSTADQLSACWDGTRFLVGHNGTVYERDSADTTTTTRTPSASPGTNAATVVTYGGVNADIYMAVADSASGDPKRIRFNRGAGTWDAAWTTIEATTLSSNQSLHLRRSSTGNAIDAIYGTGTSSPYTARFDRVPLNTAPSASTWATAAGAADVAASLLVDWNFVDPDAGDTQSAYALRRQIGTGAYSYWNAATSTWGATEVKNITSTSQVTLAAGWGADIDPDYKFAVKAWDAADAVGPYGSELVVTPSALVNPTLTAPAAAAVLSTSATTATWTVAQQQAYRLRLYNSTGVTTLWDSGWVTDTVARARSIDFVLANSTTYQAGIQTRNAESLASTEARNTFSVSYTAPATPTLTTVAGTPAGAITITITNPTPTGSQPAVSSNELWVRVAAGGSADGERPVGGTGVRIRTGLANNAAVIDWAAASGRNYQYLVRAIGANGTTADSAWTG
jgi:hypothetical protein